MKALCFDRQHNDLNISKEALTLVSFDRLLRAVVASPKAFKAQDQDFWVPVFYFDKGIGEYAMCSVYKAGGLPLFLSLVLAVTCIM